MVKSGTGRQQTSGCLAFMSPPHQVPAVRYRTAPVVTLFLAAGTRLAMMGKMGGNAPNPTRSPTLASRVPRIQIPYLRWWIMVLIFLATVINYLDRLTVSVLSPVIRESLKLSNVQYATIGSTFLAAYTVSQALSGKLYDQFGIRRGFTGSVLVWSVAAMMHATSRGLGSLCAFRFMLGLGEAGNWPGAAKTAAEWLPQRERALGLAVFNSGTALGSVVAPPLIVWIQKHYGWQATFLLTGGLGFCWLLLWLLLYRSPDKHPWMTERERSLIMSGKSPEQQVGTIPWVSLLRYRKTWAVVLGRTVVDPVWWLYLLWLPEYLNKARGFSLAQ